MKRSEFIKLLNDCAQAGRPAMVQHHMGDRLGPVLEAKAVGFNGGAVMVKLCNGPGGWCIVDPKTWDVVPGKGRS